MSLCSAIIIATAKDSAMEVVAAVVSAAAAAVAMV